MTYRFWYQRHMEICQEEEIRALAANDDIAVVAPSPPVRPIGNPPSHNPSRPQEAPPPAPLEVPPPPPAELPLPPSPPSRSDPGSARL